MWERARRLRIGLLLALAAFPPAASATPQSSPADEPRLPPGSEGALQNDVFLPVHPSAGGRLSAGDQSLERARRAQREAERERLLTECFEAWRAPFAEDRTAGAQMDALWVPAATGGERRFTKGLDAALADRLSALTGTERERWTARFEPAARNALATAAYDPVRLVALARSFPLTRSAGRAALRLADLSLERGYTADALAWTRRGLETLPGGAADLAQALEQRRRLARASAASSDGTAGGAWTTGEHLEPVTAIFLESLGRDERSRDRRFEDRRFEDRSKRRREAEIGVQPGLAFLPEGRFAVHSAERVSLFGMTSERGEPRLTRLGAFDPQLLLPDEFRAPGLDPRASPPPPGWPLRPAATPEGDLLLVAGRSDELWSNALLCVRPPDTTAAGVEPRRPRAMLDAEEDLPLLRWAISGFQLLDPRGQPRDVPPLLDPELGADGLEFQPGPVVAGDQVVVQARVYAGTVQAWLFGLDRHTGELLWRRLLATGADLVKGIDRFQTGSVPRLSAQPLATRDGLVFAGTHLGAGALVEALDGRLRWSLKCRRRAAKEPGWPGERPLFGLGGSPALLWAPFDSDHLYVLSADARPASARRSDGTQTPFAAPPRPLGESLTLLGGTAEEALVQGRAGREWTVSARRGPGTDRLDALYLGPEEAFQGRGLASKSRVLACTDRGLYLFDRSRDLYLLDYAPLPALKTARAGGDLYARGELVLALSDEALWAFRAR